MSTAKIPETISDKSSIKDPWMTHKIFVKIKIIKDQKEICFTFLDV